MDNLKKPVFTLLPVKDIKPQGWLLQQLKIQAEGLSGNLDKFWPDIKDSKWIGGDKEGWERVPYWLDGFIPLAWLLDNEDMKARAAKYIDFIISHQDAEGWICPGEEGDRGQYDMWALFLILKVLVLYQDMTGDPRIEGVVRKALTNLDRHIDSNTLFSWAQTRWFECLIPIWWLYERTGEEWLFMLASKLHSQGFDWIEFYQYWPYKTPDEKGRWSQMSHVVNNAMALKAGALYSRMTGREEELHSAEKMVEMLDEYHGMVTGVFTGDECLAGKSPIHGTELCAVAEYMYSLEHLIALTGKASLGDRLEKIAFNALPAAFGPDMWTHQYDQQVNQVECSRQERAIFNTNGGDSHLFGLEPNFGCCTANLNQPWPKFAMNTIMKTEDGIAAVLYAPTSVRTEIGSARVTVTMETEYPFKDTIHIRVITDKPVRFPLYLRIPSWCEDSEVILNRKKLSSDGPDEKTLRYNNLDEIGITTKSDFLNKETVKSDNLYKETVKTDSTDTVKTDSTDTEIIKYEGGIFAVLEQDWEGETQFTLRLPMKAKAVSRPNGLYAIVRGPLVYSLKIKEKWVQINQDMIGREYPHCDYEIYPESSWNYGLRLDKDNLKDCVIFEEGNVGNMPFSPDGAPVKAKVKGSKIDWSLENGSAAIKPALSWISEEVEELTLIPYGCTNLRLTEMPII